MYAQQMAKGKAALQRGAYGDILSKCIPFVLFLFLLLMISFRRICLWFKSNDSCNLRRSNLSIFPRYVFSSMNLFRYRNGIFSAAS